VPEFLPQDVFAFMLAFCRIGAALMLMPGIGEQLVPQRVRLSLALGLTAAMLPSLPPAPALPDAPASLAMLVGGETLIGLAIGMIARLTLTALHVAGAVIGMQTGLSFAQFYDPTQGTQNVLIGSLLSMMAMVAIFATDLHLPMIQGIADSYMLIAPGAALPVGDTAMVASHMFASTFALGMKIASPFIVYGILFNVGTAVVSRLMPQIQISFVIMPLQIMLGYGLLLTTMPAIMLWFLDAFGSTGVLGTR